MQQPQGFSFGGYTDWRVPTKDELLTLVYCSSGKPKIWNDTGDACEGDYERPTIDQIAFPWIGVGIRAFWSSSRVDHAQLPMQLRTGLRPLAWDVYFGHGNVGYGNQGYVRLVRGGPPQAMSDRYRPLGADGSIIEDHTTGLQWMRCSQGQHWKGVTCDGEAAKLTWEEAMQQPQGFSSEGYTDWRVPTKDELRTLVYCSSGQPKTWNDTGDSCEGDYERPTIDQIAFPWIGVGIRAFWSSSPYAYGSSKAWG